MQLTSGGVLAVVAAALLLVGIGGCAGGAALEAERKLLRAEAEAEAARKEKEQRALKALRESEEDRERARRHRRQQEEAQHQRELRRLYRDGEAPPAPAQQQGAPGDGAQRRAPRTYAAAAGELCTGNPCACIQPGMPPAAVLQRAGEPDDYRRNSSGAVWSYARERVIEQVSFSGQFPYEVTRLRC